jgi:hypothetical protein
MQAEMRELSENAWVPSRDMYKTWHVCSVSETLATVRCSGTSGRKYMDSSDVCLNRLYVWNPLLQFIQQYKSNKLLKYSGLQRSCVWWFHATCNFQLVRARALQCLHWCCDRTGLLVSFWVFGLKCNRLQGGGNGRIMLQRKCWFSKEIDRKSETV